MLKKGASSKDGSVGYATLGLLVLVILLVISLILFALAFYYHRKKHEPGKKPDTLPGLIEPHKISEPPTPSDEHIYEEIPDFGDTYDHLQYYPQYSIPIPTDSIYHNFLLLKQESGINQ